MSFMHLLAADRALPDRDCRTERTVDCGKYIEHGDLGFAIEPCHWSHHGMTPEGRPNDMEHVQTKPYLFNIELVPNDEQTFRDLKQYLTDVLSPGESVELWQVWLGGPFYQEGPQHFCGDLKDLEMDTFSLLFQSDEVCIDIRA